MQLKFKDTDVEHLRGSPMYGVFNEFHLTSAEVGWIDGMYQNIRRLPYIKMILKMISVMIAGRVES